MEHIALKLKIEFGVKKVQDLMMLKPGPDESEKVVCLPLLF